MSQSANSTPQAFVIGWPIKHSRSPLIHNYWLRSLGLAGSYERLAVEPEALADFIAGFPAKGFVGGNVTLPHKEQAFRLCAHATATARRLAAVNTLWIEDGRLCGDNTDVAGFLANLDAEAPGWDKKSKTALVIGAGGAARAIVHGLQSRGQAIMLVNRTLARSRELVQQFEAHIELCDWGDLSQVLQKADLLVNTTSLGMTGQPPLDIDVEALPAAAIVADIVYVPLETELIRRARRRGLQAVGGLGMLLHQAVPGFEKWFGRRPQVSPQLRALVEADVLAAEAGKT